MILFLVMFLFDCLSIIFLILSKTLKTKKEMLLNLSYILISINIFLCCIIGTGLFLYIVLDSDFKAALNELAKLSPFVVLIATQILFIFTLTVLYLIKRKSKILTLLKVFIFCFLITDFFHKISTIF